MTQDQQFSQDHLQLLREIRDGQQKIIEMMLVQQALAEEQVKRSRESVAESVGLQRLALQRQRTITFVAIPAILVCIAAICYLVLRYF